MRNFMQRRPGRVSGLVLFALAIGTAAAGSSSAAQGSTLWASPSGSGTACTAPAPCSLAYAVTNAPAGGTVRALGGTYHGGVVISTPLTLHGSGNSILDASTSANGVGILVNASNSEVDHFTVENAKFEGILVRPPSPGSTVSNVRIDHNAVLNNDTGYAAQTDGECHPNGEIPGDCGEGLHLWSATNSRVDHNEVSGNAGGILLTDEFGPNTGNEIDHNTSSNNIHDCGITLASHTSNGVFDNTVDHNVADGNGTAGEGAGILIAGAGPGTRASGNVISHNEASGNGLAGITIHEHAPSNLNDNVLDHNDLRNNNLTGDPDFNVSVTTDILVGSAANAITGTVISHNELSDAQIGIWTHNAPSSLDHNVFSNVGTPVVSS
jgi:parallel beta-helix repeat protein